MKKRLNKSIFRSKISLTLLTISLITFLISCATPIENATESFQKGNYEKSLKYSLQALKDDPSSLDAKYIIKESWKVISLEKTNEIDSYLKQNTISSLETVDEVYDEFIEQSTDVKNARINDIYPIPEVNQLKEDKQAAKDILNLKYIKEGKTYYNYGDRDNSKTAYKYFMKAKDNGYMSGELTQLINDAKEKATITIYATAHKNKNELFDVQTLIKEFSYNLDKDEFINVIYDLDCNFEQLTIDNAIAKAKMANATHLLFITPEVTYTYYPNSKLNSFGNTEWLEETITVDFDYSINYNYQLMELDSKNITSGRYDYIGSYYDDFIIRGVYSDDNKAEITFGIGEPNATIEEVDANISPIGIDTAVAMSLEFKNEKITMDNLLYSLEYSLDVNPLLNEKNKNIPILYSLSNEDKTLKDYSGHTFFLFDAIAFPPVVEGEENEIIFVYNTDIKADTKDSVDDYLATAASDEQAYMQLKDLFKNTKDNQLALIFILDEWYKEHYTILGPKAFAKDMLKTL
ncbi:MAG: hypothetical protein ACPKM0_00270 [Pleomorphochaeta sp.]